MSRDKWRLTGPREGSRASFALGGYIRRCRLPRKSPIL